jgi:hypothetical protein
MKKNLLLILAFALVALSFHSCKQDPPIYPWDKGYVQQYPPGGGGAIGSSGSTGTTGSTGSTGTTNSTQLTGQWTVQSTALLTYLDGKVVSNTSVPVNPFDGVTIDDVAKTMVFLNSGNVTNVTYTSSGSGSSETLQLSGDPFGRSSNGPIQVTSLTSSSMTWVAVDPMTQTSGGHTAQEGYQVTFSK